MPKSSGRSRGMQVTKFLCFAILETGYSIYLFINCIYQYLFVKIKSKMLVHCQYLAVASQLQLGARSTTLRRGWHEVGGKFPQAEAPNTRGAGGSERLDDGSSTHACTHTSRSFHSSNYMQYWYALASIASTRARCMHAHGIGIF